MRDKYPKVLATDIVDAPHLDMILNAEKMTLDDGSIRVIYGQNCFHHFLHPDDFFNELQRVLIPGGGFIMLDPYYGLFSQFLYNKLSRKTLFNLTSYIKPPDSSGGIKTLQLVSFIVVFRKQPFSVFKASECAPN
jgi:SAM-dependent methyltransferase